MDSYYIDWKGQIKAAFKKGGIDPNSVQESEYRSLYVCQVKPRNAVGELEQLRQNSAAQAILFGN